jgi:hypothetical protein
MLCPYAEGHYAKCRVFYDHAECHNAECYYAECRRALRLTKFAATRPPCRKSLLKWKDQYG